MATEFKRMRQLSATEAEWEAENPTLLIGEIGFATDRQAIKIGPGAWSNLPYIGGSSGGGGTDCCGNIDGGEADANFGGIFCPVNGGDASGAANSAS